MSDVEISIIVLNWNGKHWLKNCYESLRNQTFKDFEVILADNNSCDDSVEYTRANFPEVKIIRYEGNLGFCEANNKAVYRALGRYLLFLNNDTKLENNCLEELMEYVRKAGCYICTVNIADYNTVVSKPPEKIMSLGIDIFGYPSFSEKPFYCDGAALFINKELFIELGGFDEKHFIFAEDVDLSWRAQLLGYDIGFAKSAVVYHERGGTIIYSSRKKGKHITSINRRYLTERNTLRNLLKNYSFPVLLMILPVHIVLLTLEMAFFLFLGEGIVAREVYCKALIYNIVNLKDTLDLRRKIQKGRRISDFEILRKIRLGKFYK